MAAKENKILPFATNIESNDILTDEEYVTDATRTGGNIIGIAKRRPNNKALKQATLLASALAQLIANGSKEDGSADDGYDVDDTITFEQMETNLRNVLVGIIKDTAGDDDTLVHIANNETITGAKTFSKKIIANGGVQLPSTAPAGDNEAIRKGYIDDNFTLLPINATTADANGFTTPQRLACPSTVANLPVAKVGFMDIYKAKGDNDIIQVYYLNDNSAIYARTSTNGGTSWSEWKLQTVSDLSAYVQTVNNVAPDESGNVNIEIPDIKTTVLNTFFPVGSIYMDATGKINPNTQFGGTWVKIENRFLYGQGTKAIGATGGAETVKLSSAQMPAHTHSRGDMNITGTANAQDSFSLINKTGKVTGAFSRGTARTYPVSGTTDNRDSNDLVLSAANNWTGSTSVAGSGAAHENMPPYIVVAIWKRTA